MRRFATVPEASPIVGIDVVVMAVPPKDLKRVPACVAVRTGRRPGTIAHDGCGWWVTGIRKSFDSNILKISASTVSSKVGIPFTDLTLRK